MAERLFDPEILKQIAGDDLDFYQEVLQSYKVQASSLVSQLWDRANSGEAEGLMLDAHKLKGSSRSVGAVRIGDVAEQIEYAARQQDLSAAKALILDVKAITEETIEEIEAVA